MSERKPDNENDNSMNLNADELLVIKIGDEVVPRIVMKGFEGVDIPFDRSRWTSRTLALVRRRAKEDADLLAES